MKNSNVILEGFFSQWSGYFFTVRSNPEIDLKSWNCTKLNPSCIIAALISFISNLEVAIWVMIYKVAWSSWRYSACTSLLGISIFNPTSYRFRSETKKEKKLRGLSALYDGLKGSWWGSKEAAASLPHPFFQVCVWPRRMSLPIASNYLHPSKNQWSGPWLTLHGPASRSQRKRQNQQVPRGGDDWHIISLWNNIEFSTAEFSVALGFALIFMQLPFFSLSLPPFLFFFHSPQNNSTSTLRQTM